VKEIPSEGTKPFKKSEKLDRWQIEKRLKEEQQVANWNKAQPELPVTSVNEIHQLLLGGQTKP